MGEEYIIEIPEECKEEFEKLLADNNVDYDEVPKMRHGVATDIIFEGAKFVLNDVAVAIFVNLVSSYLWDLVKEKKKVVVNGKEMDESDFQK